MISNSIEQREVVGDPSKQAEPLGEPDYYTKVSTGLKPPTDALAVPDKKPNPISIKSPDALPNLRVEPQPSEHTAEQDDLAITQYRQEFIDKTFESSRLLVKELRSVANSTADYTTEITEYALNRARFLSEQAADSLRRGLYDEAMHIINDARGFFHSKRPEVYENFGNSLSSLEDTLAQSKKEEIKQADNQPFPSPQDNRQATVEDSYRWSLELVDWTKKRLEGCSSQVLDQAAGSLSQQTVTAVASMIENIEHQVSPDLARKIGRELDAIIEPIKPNNSLSRTSAQINEHIQREYSKLTGQATEFRNGSLDQIEADAIRDDFHRHDQDPESKTAQEVAQQSEIAPEVDHKFEADQQAYRSSVEKIYSDYASRLAEQTSVAQEAVDSNSQALEAAAETGRQAARQAALEGQPAEEVRLAYVDKLAKAEEAWMQSLTELSQATQASKALEKTGKLDSQAQAALEQAISSHPLVTDAAHK